MHRTTIKITFEDCEGEWTEQSKTWEEEIELPANYEICSTCLGEGSHVNPSIDSHGITMDEWENEWDDESREMYLSGGYDVTCNECKGLRVVPVIDEKYINQYGTEKQRKALKYHNESLKEEAQYNRMVASEIAYGC